MTRKWSLAAVLVPLIAVALTTICAGAAQAGTSAKLTAAQRGAFDHRMALYAHAIAATSHGEVLAQMKAEDNRLTACAPLLRQLYQGLAANSNPAAGVVDVLLTGGAQAGGERWLTSALTALNGGSDHRIKTDASANICAVLKTWRSQGYAPAHRPKLFLSMWPGGISAWAMIGTRPAHTFASWGIRKGEARKLVSEFNTAQARYEKLDGAAYGEFARWLQQHGIYKLMPPGDRHVVKF